MTPGLRFSSTLTFPAGGTTIAHFDKDTARSRRSYFIMFSGCPIVWASQLQTGIALETPESRSPNQLCAPLTIPMMRVAQVSNTVLLFK
jgi:hypothetical protein